MKLIVAVALNRVIGNNGALPWHIPSDLKKFKELTLHQKVLMGRKTYESIGHALPNRKNIVISQSQILAEDVISYTSISRALEAEGSDIWVIGGQRIFAEALQLGVSDLYITLVRLSPAGDTYFPIELDPSTPSISLENKEYIRTSNVKWEEENEISFCFLHYQSVIN
jgi:dihydrofolate reductase